MTEPLSENRKPEFLRGVRPDPDFEILEESSLYAGEFVSLSMLRCRLPGGGESSQVRIELPAVVAIVALLDPSPGDGGGSTLCNREESIQRQIGKGSQNPGLRDWR